MTISQRDRVLAALRHAGPTGLTQIDFFAPQVCDHGPPITRLAARIGELRDEGHTITSSGTRNGCAVYRLVSGGAPEAPVEGAHAPLAPAAPSESTLFTTQPTFDELCPPARTAIYDDWEDAA